MKNIGIQLRISDILFAVQKRWKLILLLTFMSLIFGIMLAGMSYVQSSVEIYRVSGSFIIAAVDDKGVYASNSQTPNRNDFILAEDLYDTVYYLMRSDRLLSQVINDQQLLGITIADIRNALSISRYNETTIITQSFDWDNIQEGLELWQAVIDTTNSLLGNLVKIGRLRIINEPEVSTVGSRKSDLKTWMMLPILGFAAGLGFSVLEVLMRPTLINVKDVETVFGLETLGIIPHDQEYFKNTGSILQKDENIAPDVVQNFGAAAFILRNRMGSKEECHCFYITSAIGQEGRTSVAANLGVQLSDMERRTLLIDLDYKNPMLGTQFLNEVEYSHSLNSLYRGEINISDAITTLTGYLDILPMVMEHNLIYMDSTIMDMISRLKSSYEFIIIDAPPVGKESDTLSLNQVASTVLYVARYNMASIPEIQSALEKLDKSGIRVLGCIVNDMQSVKNILMGTADKENTKKKETETKSAKVKKVRKKKTKKKTELPDEKVESDEKKANDAAINILIGQEKTTQEAGVTSAEATADAKGTKTEKSAKSAKKKIGLFGRKSSDKKTKDKKKTKSSVKDNKDESRKDKNKIIIDIPGIEDDSRMPRNLFDDLDDTEPTGINTLSDDEATEALLRIGLDGSWDEAANKSLKEEKKRNIFDGL